MHFPIVIAALVNPALAVEEGRILRIDGPDLYVALGLSDGVRPGQRLTIYRVVQVTDPDGKVLVDRFFLGEGQVVEAGQTLSAVRVDPALSVQVRVGDVVTTGPIERQIPPKPAPTTPSAPAPSSSAAASTPAAASTSAPAAPTDPALEAFAAVFKATATMEPAARRSAWSAWLQQFPDSDLAPAVKAEILAMDRIPTGTPGAKRAPLKLLPSAASQAAQDQPFTLWITAAEPERVEQGRLYYRRSGEEVYRIAEMNRVGDATWSGTIPADAVQAPGIEWFAGLGSAAEGEFKVGAPDNPERVEVIAPPPEDTGSAGRTAATMRVEKASFSDEKKTDTWLHVQGDFFYRVKSRPLYGVRVGYASFRGVAPDTSGEATPVALNYGYTELESRITPNVALLARGLAGVTLAGLDLGLEGRLRLGPDTGTNLLLGGSTIGGLGQTWTMELGWSTVPHVPMALGVQVSNLPGVQPDIYGVRMTYDARLEATPWLEVGGRVGYGLRDIDNVGATFGGTVVFKW